MRARCIVQAVQCQLFRDRHDRVFHRDTDPEVPIFTARQVRIRIEAARRVQHLSPQKNAEVFYRKAKNQHIEVQRLKQALEGKEKEIEQLTADVRRLENLNDLKSLREFTGQREKPAAKKADVILPYHKFDHKGYRIWVGRNAQSNDVLTFQYGYKEDLWLHVKDVPGSHVLIKHQAGKNFPKDVIERAAELR